MVPPVDQNHLPRHAILGDEARIELYGHSSPLGAYGLITSERFWRDRQPHLQQHGYLLRPRYSPDWVPSWQGKSLSPMLCEDSITSITDEVMDARRQLDNMAVAIKSVEKGCDEICIAQFLATLHDPQNHCIPVIDVLPDPFDAHLCLFVMPFLRPFDDPDFCTAGEVIDFIDQTLEGLAFMHKHRVAHRDISLPNIMMDARPLYPDEYHPVRRNYTPDARYKITPLTRADHPVRYYYIDFGLSTHFAPGTSSYVVGDIGRDTDVPELSDDVPYDPFKVDIFSLGNVYFKELDQKYKNVEFLDTLISTMKRADPSMRPPIEDVIAHWEEVKSSLASGVYRRRLAARSEQPIESMIHDTVAAAWNRFNDFRKRK